MKFSLPQLSVFQTFAKTGCLKESAKRLDLTQTEVFALVRQVEKSVGISLYEKNRNKIQLTEAGEEVVNLAESIDTRINAFNSSISDLKNIDRGRLEVTTSYEDSDFIPRLLTSFNRCHENIEVYLTIHQVGELASKLNNRQIDLAIMKPLIGNHPSISAIAITQEWSIFYRNTRQLSPLAQAFCDFAINQR